MQRALLCLVLIACGGKDPATASSTSPATTSPATTSVETAQPPDPLPPVTAVGDRCNVSKDCAPLGPHHRCMRTADSARCYEVPMKMCDEPTCECFNNDPCVANDVGSCAGYERGIVICK